MDDKVKARIMDASKIRRTMNRLATEIIERNRNLKNLVIVGIRTRGVHVARRVARLIKDLEGVEVALGVLDIAPYRDDVSGRTRQPKVRKTDISVPVAKKDVLLVDDVLMTGRTIRAAMEGLFDLGRPRTIQLLVFIDRGHRELPVRPDYVGKVLPTSRREKVRVRLAETDDADEVLITEPARLV
jgi:pyrimidine operon attenuation protein/uracil phosphoribosyltransferase